MFSSEQLNGIQLPEKTLCLTFDDGPGETLGEHPGPKTIKLAEYLAAEHISASFFMVGKFIKQYPYILPEVAGMGHLIGNHTYSHPDMQQFFKDGGDVVSEIKKTDELIIKWVPDHAVYFRAPYGLWQSELSDKVNEDLENECEHLGPFHWDIDCKDWVHWREGNSPEACANAYWKEIKQIDRGIVLMHDSTTDLKTARANNLTLETIKILVPRLKSDGYRFVRIDEIAGLINTAI